jgi:hypothetical protein
MLLRTRRTPSGSVEPCLPSPAEPPPSGPDWIREIKHDGYLHVEPVVIKGAEHANIVLKYAGEVADASTKGL